MIIELFFFFFLIFQNTVYEVSTIIIAVLQMKQYGSVMDTGNVIKPKLEPGNLTPKFAFLARDGQSSRKQIWRYNQ